ncbi:MAG TPA: DUF2269 family protein [Anaerolineales bacterium]|nr:DUF2269 family protein [Anaerolineales bacterium]HLO27968.1 DUF2269 family protein [Anaerolineales bacterium]
MLFLLVRFLHIASAMWFIGGILARQIVRAYAKRTEDVRRFATLSEAAGRIESTMVIPGNMAVIVFGVILALLIKAPILGFLQGADRNWLLVSNIILLLGFLSVPLIFLPRGKQFDVVLKDALATGQMTPALRTQLDDPVVRLAHWYEMISMPVVVFLMVFKPF